MKRPVGHKRAKLALLLSTALTASEGRPIEIDPEDIWIQEGAYRHATWDLARWGYDYSRGGIYLKIYSWDTITDCARYGITVLPKAHHRDHFEREISSNEP